MIDVTISLRWEKMKCNGFYYHNLLNEFCVFVRLSEFGERREEKEWNEKLTLVDYEDDCCSLICFWQFVTFDRGQLTLHWNLCAACEYILNMWRNRTQSHFSRFKNRWIWELKSFTNKYVLLCRSCVFLTY